MVAFFKEVLIVRSRAPAREHLVITPLTVNTDFALCARLAAGLLGTYLAEAKDFESDPSQSGCQYKRVWNKGPVQCVAVSQSISADLPSIPLLFRTAAAATGSHFEFWSEKKLRKAYSRALKEKRTALLKAMHVLCKQEERSDVETKLKPLYSTWPEFERAAFASRASTRCPGF